MNISNILFLLLNALLLGGLFYALFWAIRRVRDLNDVKNFTRQIETNNKLTTNPADQNARGRGRQMLESLAVEAVQSKNKSIRSRDIADFIIIQSKSAATVGRTIGDFSDDEAEEWLNQIKSELHLLLYADKI